MVATWYFTVLLASLTASFIDLNSPNEHSGIFQSKEIEDYLPSNLKDVKFESLLVKSNLREATKINRDYNRVIETAKGTVQAKEPFKLRVTAKVEDTNITMVMNGATQQIKISSIGLSQKFDLAKSPGRRINLLDFGILTPAIANNFYRTKFVRFDRETGNPVFDLTFPIELDYTVRMRVWIDKSKKCVLRREWYGMEGEFKATYLFSNHTMIDGVWVPGSAQTFNAENKLAAEFKYKGFDVNTGISDDLFKI